MGKLSLGKAKYGSQKKKYWKLKDGDSTFRILPPLIEKGQKDHGKWSQYYKVHYGYTNAEGKSRPFQSSLLVDYDSKEVLSADAANERIDKLKEELKKAQEKKDKKTVEGLLKFVGGPKSKYNLDSNHYMNAMDEQGNIGVLKLRHKAYKALELVIRKLRDKSVDPLSADNGRFFVFSRSGTGQETTFAVDVKSEEIEIANVGKVKKEVVHKITEDIEERLEDEAARLDKLFRTPTAEQVAQIVAESDLKTGSSPNIDDILGFKSSGGEAAEAEEEYVDEDDAAAATESARDVTPEPAAKVEVKTAEIVESAPVAAKAAVVVEPTPAPKAAPTTTAQKVSDMNDDEFLKSLGLNN